MHRLITDWKEPLACAEAQWIYHQAKFIDQFLCDEGLREF